MTFLDWNCWSFQFSSLHIQENMFSCIWLQIFSPFFSFTLASTHNYNQVRLHTFTKCSNENWLLVNYQIATETALGSFLSFTPTFALQGKGFSWANAYQHSTTFSTHGFMVFWMPVDRPKQPYRSLQRFSVLKDFHNSPRQTTHCSLLPH